MKLKGNLNSKTNEEGKIKYLGYSMKRSRPPITVGNEYCWDDGGSWNRDLWWTTEDKNSWLTFAENTLVEHKCNDAMMRELSTKTQAEKSICVRTGDSFILNTTICNCYTWLTHNIVARTVMSDQMEWDFKQSIKYSEPGLKLILKSVYEMFNVSYTENACLWWQWTENG